MNAKGFKLFNGCESITEFSVYNSHLTDAIFKMKIQHLRLFDEKNLKQI